MSENETVQPSDFSELGEKLRALRGRFDEFRGRL